MSYSSCSIFRQRTQSADQFKLRQNVPGYRTLISLMKLPAVVASIPTPIAKLLTSPLTATKSLVQACTCRDPFTALLPVVIFRGVHLCLQITGRYTKTGSHSQKQYTYSPQCLLLQCELIWPRK